jgi:hypothetical protein
VPEIHVSVFSVHNQTGMFAVFFNAFNKNFSVRSNIPTISELIMPCRGIAESKMPLHRLAYYQARIRSRLKTSQSLMTALISGFFHCICPSMFSVQV